MSQSAQLSRFNRPLKFGWISDDLRLWSQRSPEQMNILTSWKRRYQPQSLPC